MLDDPDAPKVKADGRRANAKDSDSDDEDDEDVDGVDKAKAKDSDSDDDEDDKRKFVLFSIKQAGSFKFTNKVSTETRNQMKSVYGDDKKQTWYTTPCIPYEILPTDLEN